MPSSTVLMRERSCVLATLTCSGGVANTYLITWSLAKCSPAQIILFGSQARGDARPDSDVDLLVVFDRPVDKRELRVRVGRVLAQMPFGKDILVAATGELEHPMPGTALVGAVRDGVLVYER